MGTPVQAFDVHAQSAGGHIHFQVIMPLEDLDDEKAEEAAKNYIKFAEDSKLLSCTKTGSTQGATEDQEEDIEKGGFFIYKVFGCPE